MIRGWSHESRNAGSLMEAEETEIDSPLQSSEGTQPYRHLHF